MTSIINNLLSRRSRRNTYESRLNPTWGDMGITSPTDTAHRWYLQNPKTALPLSNNPTPDLYDGATPTEPSEPTPKDMSTTTLDVKFDFEKVTSDSASAFSFVPTPRYAPLLSPSHPLRQPQEGLAIFNAVPETSSDDCILPEMQLMDHREGVYALAVHNTNSLPNGSVSPIYATDEVDDYSKHGGLISPSQTCEHIVYVPSRRPLSPAEIAALVRRPSASTPVSPQPTYIPSYPYFSSFNGAAIESLKSPVVTILSPVSETFSLNGGIHDEDGIVVLDEASDDHDRQLFRRSRSTSLPGAGYLHDLDMAPIHNTALLRFLQEPLDNHWDNHEQYYSFSPRTSSRPFSGSDSVIEDDDAISVHTDLQTETNVQFLELRQKFDDRAWGSPTCTSSPVKASTGLGLGQVQSDDTCTKKSRYVKSPSTLSTRDMRLMSPPLSATARMRKQSAPTSPNMWSPPLADCVASSQHLVWDASGIAHTGANYATTSMDGRKRSSSDAAPKPLSCEQEVFCARRIAGVKPSCHHRQNSDNSIGHVYSNSGSHLQASATTYRHHQTQSVNNLTACLERTDLRYTTSPNLQTHSALTRSPTPHAFKNESQFETVSDFHESIREDCRIMSRQSRACKNEALVAQFKVASEPSRIDQPKLQTRARSSSRLRDRLIKQQLKMEEDMDGQQLQLVPSYKEIWE